MLELWAGEYTTLSALALYLPQHFYLVGPITLGLWTLARRRLKLVLFNGLSLAFCLFFPLGLHLHLPQWRQAKTIRIVTFNVERGEADSTHMPHVKAALLALHPDVICLQESGRSTGINLNVVGWQISHAFPGWTIHHAGDVATLSRFPIIEDHVYFLKGTRRTLETVMQTPQGKVRVLNTHVSTSFVGYSPPQSKAEAAVFIWKTASLGAQTRLSQLPALRTAIDAGNARLPLILAGDFNSPPRGHFYSGLARDLNDAFAYSGNGTGYSFPASTPLLRIDYVWTRGAKARRAFVGETSASDHRPLIADVEVNS